MASYQANRTGNGDQPKSQDQRNIDNNAKNIKNAADVAIASKEPHAVAAGAAIKAADKLTDGKSTQALGKALNANNKYSPMGKQLQKASNKLSESGLSDKIGKAAAMKNGMDSKADAGLPENVGNQNAMQNIPINSQNTGGEQESSLPSSSEEKEENNKNKNKSDDQSGSSEKNKAEQSESFDGSDDSGEGEAQPKGIIQFLMKHIFATIIIIGGIIVVFSAGFVTLASVLIETDSRFEDALAISSATGGPTGYTDYNSTNDEFIDFIQRVIGVTGDDGTSDSYVTYTESPYLIVVSTIHTIMDKDSTYTYKYFTNRRIKKIAKCVQGDETATKTCLVKKVFPKYFDDLSDGEYEKYADETFDYIRDYYSYIGENRNKACSTTSSTTCTYGIDGFYVGGKGNVKEKLNLSNVKVRIMECNDRSKPVAGEDLVDFEKYVLGVAYAENEGAPEEGFKAQLVAARSYILARHVAIGGKIKTEGDNSIIEAVSCTNDQVYCDPDRGCSKNGGNVRSGLDYPKYKGPLPEDSKYRTYAKEVEGKTLLNDQGYVVYTAYNSTTQKRFNALANQNKDYKQILFEIYGNDSKATDLGQASCTTTIACSSVGTAASGDYTTWKQGDNAWGSIPLGTSSTTIARSGCTVTSIAMQIKRSGVDTSNVPGDFNPGTFVEALNKINGFSENGGIKWTKVTELVPHFKYVTTLDVRGNTQEEKLNKLKDLVGKGYYVVAEVKGATQNNEHWVAVDQVIGDKVTMMDPASSSTDMWSKYDPSKAAYFVAYKAD